MYNVTCIKCGKTFSVAEIIKWKYSNHCDKCISAMQPRGTNPEAREDARLDYMEDLKELRD